MPLKRFDTSRLKLKRARYHIGDLQTQIQQYLMRGPIYLEIAEGTTQSRQKWIVRVREEVPTDFAAIIGDVIHNLRAALDIMACELVRLNGESDDDVYFPFAKGAQHLEETIRSRNMHRASPQAIALLKSLKPYPGGNDPLRAIHDLDIIDKHQALIPVSHAVGPPDLPGLARIRFGPVEDGMWVGVPDGHGVFQIGWTLRPEFRMDFPPLPVLNLPFASQEIVPTLISLANLVGGIIESFAGLYP